MDTQDQTKTTTPSGHDGVHICHRCGWPFPNSHPSSKHRRAHNRICGTIEGYTKLIVIDPEPVSDDEHQSDSDQDNEKTPSPKIEKRIIKETGIEEKSNRSEDDLFSDAVTDFSDSGISPGVEDRFTDATTKLLNSSIEARKADENPEIFETPDAHKTEENDINMVHSSADTQIKLPDSDTKPSVPLVEDRDGSHKEDVYVLSVPSDIPLVDHAETLIQDFKDHKTIYSDVPHGDKDAENRSMVDTFEIKTVEENIEESQTSENGESSMESAVSEHPNTDFSAFVPTVIIEETKVAETQPLEMSKTVPESTDNLREQKLSPEKEIKRLESDNEHAREVIKKAEVDHSVPVLTDKHSEEYTQETVKEPESGIEDKQRIVESVVVDSKDSGKVEISEGSGVVSETLVDEGNGKLLTSQDCGVDASVGSSSRNSLEGNWGSVSVLSTASIGKSGISDAFEGPSLIESKEEIVDQKASEIKAVTVTMQNSQPPNSEADITNETEGRKRNEEAIAKVTNWSTSEHTTTPLRKNLVSETKASDPKKLSTMIQKDKTAEKTSEVKKSNLTPVNQELSPPKYIGEAKKVKKKTKGIASWVPFMCCSSVNVN